jgi:hypothetical protein
VTLGLNPGNAEPDFQARYGLFAEQIRQLGSYSAWAKTAPYVSPEWERVKKRNRYTHNLVGFGRRPSFSARELLAVELLPWHSKRVTAQIAPPEEILEQVRLAAARGVLGRLRLRVWSGLVKSLRQTRTATSPSLGQWRRAVR